jgi:hypothetical protein
VHVERIIRKLGVPDRTQAAVRALELGFLLWIQGGDPRPDPEHSLDDEPARDRIDHPE